MDNVQYEVIIRAPEKELVVQTYDTYPDAVMAVMAAVEGNNVVSDFNYVVTSYIIDNTNVPSETRYKEFTKNLLYRYKDDNGVLARLDLSIDNLTLNLLFTKAYLYKGDPTIDIDRQLMREVGANFRNITGLTVMSIGEKIPLTRWEKFKKLVKQVFHPAPDEGVFGGK